MSGRKAVHEEYLKAADEVLRLKAEVERLRINLRDYRHKHPCSHEIMCWAEEVASKALARPRK